ncbi:hypothetical protein EYF80_006375 [Liparis tanakae]|uniref:Uncharacterized protein n=1 Tax=Liparis tanakae TaxID=230148 RepID=A0A4Z2J0Q3_9TELE|nr:hypothetical protein EYF80_006375 [Liparis tanakae]
MAGPVPEMSRSVASIGSRSCIITHGEPRANVAVSSTVKPHRGKTHTHTAVSPTVAGTETHLCLALLQTPQTPYHQPLDQEDSERGGDSEFVSSEQLLHSKSSQDGTPGVSGVTGLQLRHPVR